VAGYAGRVSTNLPTFRWSVTTSENVSTVALVGELDLAAIADLRPELESLVNAGGALAIDLDALTFIDSTGLKLMLDIQRTAATTGCTMTFHRAPDVVRRLLVLTGTAVFFTFVD
jgi:anti-sigma B factor antagonist